MKAEDGMIVNTFKSKCTWMKWEKNLVDFSVLKKKKSQTQEIP